jgi:hypothetical protein
MKLSHREVKKINQAIKEILLKDWDPIGIFGTGTDVEYDPFIWPIFSLVRSGADVDEISAHLYALESDLMGSFPDNNERAISASRKLIDLKEKMNF